MRARSALVDGILDEEEAGGGLHEFVLLWLGRRVSAWVREARPGATVCGSTLHVAVGPATGRKPDLSVYFSAAPPDRGLVRAVPDVVVEIVSPNARDRRRDYGDKTREYAGARITWYWLVDPELEMFEVRGLGSDGRYVIAANQCRGTMAVPGCEGLGIDLDALWAKCARYVAS